jgi:sec-independent protein translocase protein TatB
MFDIGFSEILVIFILALIVLGPERLPRVVREVGRWVGRARAMARQFQDQLEDEVDVNRTRSTWRPTPSTPPQEAPPAAQEAPPAALTQPTPTAAHAPEPHAAEGEPEADLEKTAEIDGPVDHPDPSHHEPGP